jgi:P27 family predicted phage terminase small subunit
MGRRRQPVHVLKLKGSRYAAGRGEPPKPRAGRPRCPSWLDPEARRLWRELVPDLEHAGVLTILDGGALACLCQSWAEFRHYCEMLKREGPWVSGPDGRRVAHPAVLQRRQSWKAYKEFAALFGLDPVNRARLGVQPDEEDALAEFLMTKKG